MHVSMQRNEGRRPWVDVGERPLGAGETVNEGSQMQREFFDGREGA